MFTDAQKEALLNAARALQAVDINAICRVKVDLESEVRAQRAILDTLKTQIDAARSLLAQLNASSNEMLMDRLKKLTAAA